MLSEKMEKAINDQIQAEFYSGYLYLSMSAWFDSVDLPGAANWMRVQYQEELSHGEKMFDYIMERDGRAQIQAIQKPPAEWEAPIDAFKAAYAHEQKVTGLIGNLVEVAREEKDYATEVFLQWFINEQVEEEANVKAIVQQFKLVNESKNGLFMIDRELGGRVTHTAASE